MEVEPATLAAPDPDGADSLVSTNDPDDLAGEQTWPTEDEMRAADAVVDADETVIPDAKTGTTPRAVKRVPKGMSEYQATWILDEDDDEDGEDGDAEAQDGAHEEMVDAPEVEVDMTEADTDRKTVAFEDIEDEDEEEQ
jgi:pre-rRNA-processing protein TSR1